MIFTAELGTEDSAPGNIALGESQPEGESTGGQAPEVHAERPVPGSD